MQASTFIYLLAALTGTSPLFGAPPPTAEIVARVNGEPIFESDLRRYLLENGQLRLKQLTKSQALENLVLLRLAVQQARSQKLDELPEVRTQLDHALYNAYLRKSTEAKPEALQPSPADLKAFYEKQPLLRVRHLYLLNGTPAQQATTQKAITQIQAALKAQTPFAALVTQYSQDPNKSSQGELDSRGVHNFPPELYSKVVGLKLQEVSEPISYQGAAHFFQLLEKKPWEKAPAPYQAFLRSSWREEQSGQWLRQQLKNLRASAKVEISLKDTP